MNLEERLEVLIKLGHVLKSGDEYLDAVIHQTSHKNLWFTKENCNHAIQHLADNLLNEAKLNAWVQRYFIDDNIKPKQLGLAFSGLIPLENFHDVICTFVQGHQAQIKLAEKDQYIIPYLIKIMDRMNDRSGNYLKVVNKISKFDAIIANASTSNYHALKKYFSTIPAIVRNRKNAVAILNQKENEEELSGISEDIFTYFGFGVRNISKIYLPENYDFNPLMEKLHERKELILHGKYKSNFDYNYSIHVMNKDMIVANGCIILTENKELQSRIAGLHYEYYKDEAELERKLQEDRNKIEMLSGNIEIENFLIKPFGKCLSFELDEYQGQEDTMEFLLSLA